MLVFDAHEIGNRLFAYRKKLGLTQCEVAERAGLSDRSYADIERGTVNMRMETILRICSALHVTPNEILMREADEPTIDQAVMLERLEQYPFHIQETAWRLVSTYLDSLQ